MTTAACEGHLDVVKLLLKEGTSPDLVDRWDATPLDEALKYGHQKVAVELRKYGATQRSTVSVASILFNRLVV